MTTTRGVLQATRAGISALAAFSQIVTGPGVSRAVLADDLRALDLILTVDVPPALELRSAFRQDLTLSEEPASRDETRPPG